MTPSFEARQEPNLESEWEWFDFQAELIDEERGRAVEMMMDPNKAFNPGLSRMRFVGSSRRDIDAFFDLQLSYLEILIMFGLLATTESILRLDFKTRVKTRGKDGLSKQYRALSHQHRKIRLDEDILAAMAEQGVPAPVIGDMRGALKLRHWLAHGRYWKPKLGKFYVPRDIFDIATALINSLKQL